MNYAELQFKRNAGTPTRTTRSKGDWVSLPRVVQGEGDKKCLLQAIQQIQLTVH